VFIFNLNVFINAYNVILKQYTNKQTNKNIIK